MQTEFYRSQTDLIPTFSLVVAASLVGLNPSALLSVIPVCGRVGIEPSMARYAHAFYGRPHEVGDQSAQLAALRQFAEGLLKQTEDSPQGVFEIVNQHFWDLV